MSVTGTLRLEGRPVGGVDVHAFDVSGEHPSLVATAISDDEGHFSIDAPPAAALLAKLRGDTLALASGPAGEDLAVPGPLARVTLEVAVERLNVYFDPLSLTGVSQALTPFATQQAVGVFDGHFAQRAVSEGELTVALAPGTWRIGGDFIVDGPVMVEPDHVDVVVDRVLANGVELPRSGSGFELEVRDDARLEFVLREVSDSER